MRCSVPIATYNVTGIPEALAAMGEKRIGVPNVTLVFSNDINGMVSLKDAYMKMRYEYQEQVPVKQEKNTIKDDKGAEKKKEEKEEKAEKTEEKPEEKTTEKTPEEQNPQPVPENGTEANPEANAEANAETNAEAKPAEPKKEEVQTVTVTKRKIRKVSLRITPLTERLVILPMSKEQQEKSVAL